MKNLYSLFFILVIFWGFFSCKFSQKNIEDKNQEQKKDSVSSSIPVIKSDSNIYRIIVSFYSKGSGTDSKIKQKYKEFIKDIEQDKGIILTYDITTWGEEGETDYCFKLSELKPIEQVEFVNNSRSLLKESVLVIVEENTICKHKK